MAGININLLPVQSRTDQKAQKKFQVIQSSSIAILLILIFLASLVTALNILQFQNISKLKSESKLREERVALLKDKEAQVSVLKNRLTLINQINKTSIKDNSRIYRSFLGYISPGVNISSVAVDRGGRVIASIVATDTLTLEQTLSNLTSDSAMKNISEIGIDSLSRGRDGSFRAILKIQN
ncbi:MAG: hypothetical protein G01um101493_237 [Microgenomates group bacterium Gr01-1014_93]|nr:MAG: hypothetical protein G01um101493_237 [Microgenomates group bacterium Gr01-1014_93]